MRVRLYFSLYTMTIGLLPFVCLRSVCIHPRSILASMSLSSLIFSAPPTNPMAAAACLCRCISLRSSRFLRRAFLPDFLPAGAVPSTAHLFASGRSPSSSKPGAPSSTIMLFSFECSAPSLPFSSRDCSRAALITSAFSPAPPSSFLPLCCWRRSRRLRLLCSLTRFRSSSSSASSSSNQTSPSPPSSKSSILTLMLFILAITTPPAYCLASSSPSTVPSILRIPRLNTLYAEGTPLPAPVFSPRPMVYSRVSSVSMKRMGPALRRSWRYTKM
mmetsp:Transcript_11781/g.25492  ORF Transcript_11781/g.25492 Transcript_11781/m.25492 type:complete len:273 (+) Transcript_11781:82-900(+)